MCVCVCQEWDLGRMHPPKDRMVQRDTKGCVLGPDGTTRSVHITSPCPALAFNSGPLWTMHNHILEEPPTHKRIDGGNLLEISRCTISYGLRASSLEIVSLFLEKTFFNPSGNMHNSLPNPSPRCPLPDISSIDAGVLGGGREGKPLRLYLAHRPL